MIHISPLNALFRTTLAMGVLGAINMALMLVLVSGDYHEECPVEPQTGSTTGYCECTSSYLSVTCYGLDTVAAAAFSGLSVEHVDLSSNPIRDRISGKALSGLEHSLESFNIESCEMTTLPDGLLVGMSEIIYVNLAFNNIAIIPNGFFLSTPKLLIPRLSNNHITSLNQESVRGARSLHTWNRRFYLAPLRVLWSGTVVAPQKGSFRHPSLGFFGKNP